MGVTACAWCVRRVGEGTGVTTCASIGQFPTNTCHATLSATAPARSPLQKPVTTGFFPGARSARRPSMALPRSSRCGARSGSYVRDAVGRIRPSPKSATATWNAPSYLRATRAALRSIPNEMVSGSTRKTFGIVSQT